MIYKILFLVCVFIGAVTSPEAVIKFSDAPKITLAFPNLLGVYFLCGKVARDLEKYIKRLCTGEIISANQSSI